jgi:hypothetical protein
MITIRSYEIQTPLEAETQYRIIARTVDTVRDLRKDGTYADHKWASALDRFLPVHVIPQAWILDDDVDEERNPWTFEFGGMKLADLIESMSWPRIEIVTFSTPEAFLAEVDALTTSRPYILSFDHDLRSATTGSDCARILCEKLQDMGDITPPQYLVHSANPSGAKNITSHIESYRKYLNLLKNNQA